MSAQAQISAEAKPPESIGDLAAFYRVSLATIKRWRAKSAPLHSVQEMKAWAGRQNQLPKGFVVRIGELTKPEKASNRDWEDFLREHPSDASPDQVKQIQNLERHLHFADFALQKARARDDAAYIKVYTDDLFRFSKAIKEQKALADRLGLESGELLPKREAERIIASWCYWSMVAIDAVLPTLCKRLVGQTGPAAIRDILEPALLRAKFLEPFQQAKRVAAGNNLPPWFVEAMVGSVDDYLQSGRELLTASVPDNGPTPTP